MLKAINNTARTMPKLESSETKTKMPKNMSCSSSISQAESTGMFPPGMAFKEKINK